MNKRENFVNDLSLEARFLVDILCSHVHQQAIPVIPNEINWRTFLSICYATHYAGICQDLLKLYDSTDIPEEVFHQLKSYQLRVLTSNERLLHQYAALEKLADEQQLTLYPLKGITMMPHLYQKRYHRHISDIDVLIDPMQLSEWELTLTKNNFRIKRRHAKSDFHEQNNLKYDPLQAFKDDAVVDFHVSLNSGFHHIGLPIESLQMNHEDSHELNHVDQLIFVCLHAYKHLYYGQLNLLHLMDIFLLKKGIPSNVLLERCAYFNCQNEVEQAINISLFFFGDDQRNIPFWQKAILENELKSNKIPRYTKWLFIYRKHLQIPVILNLLPSYLWFQVFPSADYLQQSDGHSSYAVNWLRRVFRLITNR